MPVNIITSSEASGEVYGYWRHFLALEADFAATARYVEFSQNNFQTFSIEYAKLLLAIGSEVDVLCKVICEKIDSAAKRRNIEDYRNCIMAHCQIATEEVLIRRYNLTFKPWESWMHGRNPPWWTSYNNVKHQRDIRFHEANLENCLNAISGLFVIVLYCHKAAKSSSSLYPCPLLLGRDKEPGHLLLEAGYVVPDFT
jgi:hypothetical protein